MGHIQLAANSGVLVSFGGRRVLVDGIYGKNRFFSPPLKEVQRAVFGMDSPYRDVDFLLFTHRHTDHFDAAYTDEYARNNRVRGIYVPQAGADPASFLEDRRPLPKAAEQGVLHELSPEKEQALSIPLWDDCAATYVPTRHLDVQTYAAVRHCAVLLSIGRVRLLFAADADWSPENRERFLALGPLTAVFITPLFLLDPDGRCLLEQIMPEQVVLYHLPFQRDDVTGLRAVAEKELARSNPFRLTALMEPGQMLDGIEPWR